MDPFTDFVEYRRAAVRYWEIRRIVWNLLLVAPALFGYFLYSGSSLIFGDTPAAQATGQDLGITSLILDFFAAVVAANACYTSAYLLEFFMASPDRQGGWVGGGRSAIFIVGCAIGVGLAYIGGNEIAHQLSLQVS